MKRYISKSQAADFELKSKTLCGALDMLTRVREGWAVRTFKLRARAHIERLYRLIAQVNDSLTEEEENELNDLSPPA